jgi:MYXO-CTERM domain-containing protein
MRCSIACAIIGGVGLAAPLASASIVETELNNTFATADVLVRDPGIWADTGILELGGAGGAGDVDFFSISLVEGEIIVMTTTPLDDPPVHGDPDTIIGIFDSGGALLDFDDDDGIGLGSSLFFAVPSTGTYFIGITGFPDFDFLGDHPQDGFYLLSVKVAPAPGALALLGLAGIFGRSRRRSA